METTVIATATLLCTLSLQYFGNASTPTTKVDAASRRCRPIVADQLTRSVLESTLVWDLFPRYNHVRWSYVEDGDDKEKDGQSPAAAGNGTFEGYDGDKAKYEGEDDNENEDSPTKLSSGADD